MQYVVRHNLFRSNIGGYSEAVHGTMERYETSFETTTNTWWVLEIQLQNALSRAAISNG